MDIRKFLGVLIIFKVSWLLYNCVLYVCHKIEGVTDSTSKKPEDIIPPTDDKQDKKIAEFQHYEEREKNLFKQIESERAISQQNNEIIREFEEILNQVLQDRNKLYEHKTLALQHLANIEYSFYDVTTKYERAKRVVEQYRENETALLTTIQNAQRSMNHQEEKYNKLKKHAHEKLTEANIGKQNPLCFKIGLLMEACRQKLSARLEIVKTLYGYSDILHDFESLQVQSRKICFLFQSCKSFERVTCWR